MLKIYVARHGQNEDNANGILNGHRDMPLTDIGVKQAHELAQGIKESGLVFDKVYTSPLSRAARTAEIICETLGRAKPVIVPTLIERDFGIMTGRPVSDILKVCGKDILQTSTITYFLSPEGAETFQMLLGRATLALRQIGVYHKDGSILLVTHGDFGKMLYAAHYGIGWRETLLRFHFGNCELLLLDEGADPSVSHVIKIEQHNH